MNIQIKKIWTELNESIVVNKRELVLGIATCTLTGILLGVFLSPRKVTTIGSNNGSNNTGNTASLPTGPDASCEEEEAE